MEQPQALSRDARGPRSAPGCRAHALPDERGARIWRDAPLTPHSRPLWRCAGPGSQPSWSKGLMCLNSLHFTELILKVGRGDIWTLTRGPASSSEEWAKPVPKQLHTNSRGREGGSGCSTLGALGARQPGALLRIPPHSGPSAQATASGCSPPEALRPPSCGKFLGYSCSLCKSLYSLHMKTIPG